MTETLTAAWYRDVEYFDRERATVWSTEWIMFCPAFDLSSAGGYVADSVAGWPVFVARAPDGSLVGYHNVCPHRAGVIVWPGTGRAGNLVCRYHGWAFDWDGSLRTARDFGGDTGDGHGLCADEQHLRPVAVAEWRGLVFVNLSPTATLFTESIGPFATECEPFELESFRYARRVVRQLHCNWKTYVDNYLEGYHVPLLHPSLNRTLKMSSYRVDVPHHTYCIHRADTAEGSPSGGAWLFRYPNLAVNIYADGMNVERIVPDGHRRTQVIYDYFARAEIAHDPEAIDAMVEMSNIVLDEDQLIVEAVQRNLDAGVYHRGRLSPKHEGALVWFQQRILTESGSTATPVTVRS